MIKFIVAHLKDIIFVFIFLLSSIFGIIAYKNMTRQLEQAHIDFKQLSDTVARASTDFVSKKDLQKFATDLQIDLNMMQNDMNKLGADLLVVGSVVAQIKATPSTIIIGHAGNAHAPLAQPATCALCDVHEYTLRTQTADATLMGLPVAHLTFDASKPPTEAWTQSTDKIEITTDTVVGQQVKSSELVFYHEIKVANKTLNKEIKLPIMSSAYKQIPPSTHWYWLAPALNLGIISFVGLKTPVEPTIGGLVSFSLMGYGTSTANMSLEVLSVGGGYSGAGWFVNASPLRWNFGRLIPLLTNLWLAPDIIWNGSWGMGLSLTARI